MGLIKRIQKLNTLCRCYKLNQSIDISKVSSPSMSKKEYDHYMKAYINLSHHPYILNKSEFNIHPFKN